MMEYSSKDGIFFAGREVHIVKILITYSMQKQGERPNPSITSMMSVST